MTEYEVRSIMAWASTSPSINQKLDFLIALLTQISQSTAATAASWIKGYKPTSLNELMPDWTGVAKEEKRMTAAQAIEAWGRTSKRT